MHVYHYKWMFYIENVFYIKRKIKSIFIFNILYIHFKFYQVLHRKRLKKNKTTLLSFIEFIFNSWIPSSTVFNNTIILLFQLLSLQYFQSPHDSKI